MNVLPELATRPLVSYVVATFNRPDDLAEAIQSILDQTYRPIEIVVVSSSTDTTPELFEDSGQFDSDYITYLHLSERTGVPRARNIGYEHASGDIVVTLDDDAVLAHTDATDKIVAKFREYDDVAVIAFKSLRYSNGKPILREIPSPPDFELPPPEQRVSTFCGVGNAIRRTVFETVGTFDGSFVYGFEEQDLSIRILDAGFDILYVPSIVVCHKQTPKSRLPRIEVQERRIENRIRIALRNLPWRYVVLTVVIWSAYGLVTTGFRLSVLARVYRRLYADRASLLVTRDTIQDNTIALLKSRSTLLFGWWYGPHPRRFMENPRRVTW